MVSENDQDTVGFVKTQQFERRTTMQSEIDLGNSDVWGMQCFCSVVSKMVSEHDHWASPKTLNYQDLIVVDNL